jgi:hypothetical protein
MTDTPPDDPDAEPDDDSDDAPNPYGPITTANIAPVLLPPNIA